jgi:hypothetical protein
MKGNGIEGSGQDLLVTKDDPGRYWKLNFELTHGGPCVLLLRMFYFIIIIIIIIIFIIKLCNKAFNSSL